MVRYICQRINKSIKGKDNLNLYVIQKMLCSFVDTEIVILTLNVCVLVFLLCVELNINVMY
jgi:hypothetical protein